MIQKFFFTREFRRYPFFFLLLGSTLLLGTLGLVSISIVAGQVKTQLENNAHNLLTSDFVVSARRELFPEEQAKVSAILKDKNTYQVTDLYSMVSHPVKNQTRLVELRGVEGAYPFYGDITLQTGKFSTDKFYVSRDLSELWNIQIGDILQVGEIQLPVQGIVINDTSVGLRGFSLAPRAYIPLIKLTEAGLMKRGVTGGFARHFRLPGLSTEDLKKIKTEIYEEINDSAVRVSLPEDSSEQTGRVIHMISNFMALAALIGLVLSLVGIFYLYQSHLQARLKDLCLMNLFGLTKTTITSFILAQYTLIFFIVMILDLLIVIPGYKIFAPMISQSIGLDLGPSLDLMPVFSNLPFLFGLSLSILVPLLAGLLRTPMGMQLKSAKISLGRFRFYDFIPFLLLLWAFSWHLADSMKVGSLFFASLILVFVLSTIVVRGLQILLRKTTAHRGLLLPDLPTGLALKSLARSGHRLTLSFLSIALGATLISLILQLDRMIQNEFVWDKNKPGLFIFDIQEEQIDSFKAFALEKKAPLDAITPMIRARLIKVNDEKFEKKKSSYSMRSKEDDDDERVRNNGLNLTYRSYLTAAEKIVEGEPFPKEPRITDGPVYVSIEKRWSERSGIVIGDKVLFDIQGVELEGVVRNIREVKWTSFYPNFFVTLEPGMIEGAPKTYLAVLPTGTREGKLSFQREAAEKFPNISFIDVEELVSKISVLFDKSRKAIEIISYLSLLVGFVILYGLSHDQVYRRYYDIALMKSLGIPAMDLRRNLLIEFGSLFFVAMSMGLGLGWLIAQVLGREIFKLGLTIDWMRMFVPGVFLLTLCTLTILVSSWRIVEAKPRELLSQG